MWFPPSKIVRCMDPLAHTHSRGTHVFTLIQTGPFSEENNSVLEKGDRKVSQEFSAAYSCPTTLKDKELFYTEKQRPKEAGHEPRPESLSGDELVPVYFSWISASSGVK